MISGGLGFILGAVAISLSSSAQSEYHASATETESIVSTGTAPQKLTSLLRRHERQSPEASTEAEAIIASIQRRKEARLEEIDKRSRGFLTWEDRQEREAIEKEADQELSSRLSPDEYHLYRGQRYKETYDGRRLVQILGVNEDELAAVAEYKRVQFELDPNADNDLKYQEMKKELSAKVGEERASLFLSMHDPDFSENYAFTQRFGLDTSIARDLLRLKHESLMDRMKMNQEILNGARYDPEVYQERTRQIGEQTHKRLNDLVGEDAAKIFIRDAEHATWLR